MSNDRGTVRLVVGGLALITLAMLALVGIIAVDDSPATVPEALWTLLGGAIGALSAMLARTSTAPDAPVPPAPPAPVVPPADA
jgi:hypothetical protein